jgi:hypothetical protein
MKYLAGCWHAPDLLTRPHVPQRQRTTSRANCETATVAAKCQPVDIAVKVAKLVNKAKALRVPYLYAPSVKTGTRTSR